MTAVTAPDAPAGPSGSGNPVLDRVRALPPTMRQQTLFGLILLAMFVGSMPFVAQMRDADYLMLQLATYSAVLVMALGQTFVVLQVGFDLSTGAVQGFTGGLVYLLVGRGFTDGLMIVGCLVAATAIGAVVHGLLITRARMNYFIVTLATYTILPSLLRVILDGASKPVHSPALDTLANGEVLGIRTPIIVAAVVFAVLWVVLNRTVFGRNVYAVGSNREAARLAGLPVTAITMACYGICSLCAGIAGLLLLGNLGAADPSAGIGNEFFALTAVLLGGTRFSGGQGSLFGTLLGILFLVVLANILLLSGMPQFWIGAVQGVVLLVAVGIDRARRD
ncbi:ABC transporter permease [Pimelobacter simplex]|uniref:Ribose ABC transport system, permease protein RbsC n=1 Tax=Nocardioides simplex TaxID=2045 RepID=A0A0A1DRD3_NOCSI|nr:ABC transporter permease [Pimelobacter simplex]AIY19919.2 Ribose ABC transport system, permease protein RbsC [Pimelobacter simplex]MCG8149873.1 ABC transporter permease [Pimelobacter simplex]GEB13919.1 ribose ABC transporter permease [Pimelobacter simplex]SFM66410.1 monosaccharide ABC transporter membrane protein, CUT2 family [Pimelobacter simplex]